MEDSMNEITKVKSAEPKLPALPTTILPAISELITSFGFPREMLASDEEIEYAWHDLPRELRDLPNDIEGELLVRMCVAVSTGLFDSAVNYIWNASILHLRGRVRNFGLSVVAQIRQTDFEEKHLLELQDSQLLELCHKLNILNEDGFFFLDQCRDIRNNFSAAHPTIGKINDREFITFLNRCVKYALADSSSPRGVNISEFIVVLKSGRFTDGQLQVWTDRLASTHDAQRQLLIRMTHGVYCDPGSPEPARLNSLDLCNALKANFSTNIKSELINSHSEYSAKGDDTRHRASLQFFENLGLLNLLSESERHTIISKAVSNLWTVHKGMNNFYNEPPFADRLYELSHSGKIPQTVQEQYVQTVIGCLIGEGHGVSWAAEGTYQKMVREFSPREISILLNLAKEDGIIYKRIRSSSSCKLRFIQALDLIDQASLPTSAKADYDRLRKRLGSGS